MKTLAAFFRLVRWPNLLFIILTQLLFFYFVYSPLLSTLPSIKVQILFFILILASVCIAAAGYIINDYFDIQIDAINKPNKVVINKYIKRRWAIIWHWILSVIGIILSLYVCSKTNAWSILFFNVICVIALWFYSTTFKKKLLIGNIIIAALTAWVILVVYLFAGANLISLHGFNINNLHFDERRFFKFSVLYAGFAFIATLIREVIKDLEDMEGDRKYDCNTMPIAWGVPATKVFVAVWVIVAIAALSIVQLYAWQSGWWFAALYLLSLLIFPLFYLLKKLYYAGSSNNYNELSKIIKLIILAGILSMIFLKSSV
ncbi:MAG: geranylgeranylglycerol-phosphate geranylgeranyltransferase [Ferruginibacter sp.]|nr:geranylgeranylglycerol-phosphate geranylgeranyltransferase [Ferruginibacter sp.]